MPDKTETLQNKKEKFNLYPEKCRITIVTEGKAFFSFILILMLFIPGCYHYRVIAPYPEPATEYEKRTVHSLFWGLMQPRDISAEDCLSNALDEVQVTHNLGYSIISVATLGIWMPMDVRWRCAKEPLIDGEI